MSVYACTDLHGCLWAWEKIKKILQPEDTLYFLGDAIDRGEHGWQILKEMLNDSRIIYIKGNHEDMMCRALTRFPNYDIWSRQMLIWDQNGNIPTLNAIEADNENNVKEVLRRVTVLPIYATYNSPNGNIFWLSHAGCDYTEEGIEIYSTDELLWDRNHFLNNRWFEAPDNVYIVHGHTPIPYLVEELSEYNDNISANEEIAPGAYYYADGHKICLDCGSVWTGVSVLLNLDTFEEIVLEE